MLLRYALAFLGTIILAGLSGLAYVVNPVSWLFVVLAAPAVSLLGFTPPIYGFSSMGSALAVSLLWPLTLTPLHWLNYRLLGWGGWRYLLLVVGVGAVIAFIVLLVNAAPAD